MEKKIPIILFSFYVFFWLPHWYFCFVLYFVFVLVYLFVLCVVFKQYCFVIIVVHLINLINYYLVVNYEILWLCCVIVSCQNKCKILAHSTSTNFVHVFCLCKFNIVQFQIDRFWVVLCDRAKFEPILLLNGLCWCCLTANSGKHLC